MAWSTLPLYSSGGVLTAAQMNAIAANINETAPSRATTTSTFFVGAGPNSIEERSIQTARSNSQDQTGSTTYTELTTTQRITYSSYATALVLLTARLFTSTAGEICLHSVYVTGSSSITADDQNALIVQSTSSNSRMRATAAVLLTSTQGLVSGSNQYRAHFRVTGGTLTAADREMTIIAL
jgi:hypothetical protein